jgi:malic enzyme
VSWVTSGRVTPGCAAAAGRKKLSFASASISCRFINGMKAQGTELKDARIVFFGAGSSAVGVAKSIASVIELKGGVSAEDAKKVLHASFTLHRF